MKRRDFLRGTLSLGAAALLPNTGVPANWNLPIVEPETIIMTNQSFPTIFRAADSGFVQDVKYFIEQLGIDVNVKGMYGCTPLHWAVDRCESLEVVQYLVAHGADINMEDNDGDTPLVRAASHGSLDVVQYLVSLGADVNAKGTKPINAAASHGNWEIVKYLVEKGADVNVVAGYSETPLHFAIDADNLEIVQYLLDNGASVHTLANREKMSHIWSTPLHWALPQYRAAQGKNSLPIVQCLVSHGADAHAKDSSGSMPLHNAAGYGSLEVVKFLVSLGSDVNVKNDQGFTPLHWAAEYGNLNVMQYLVSQGADVNAKAKEGVTPLYSASSHSFGGDRVDGSRYLVSEGADVHVVFHDGKTLLHCASDTGAILYLLSQGVDINAKDNEGKTPLHGADGKKLKCLIAAGADVNVKDNTGKTPLHGVVTSTWYSQMETVQDLVSHGADVNAKDYIGNTPLHIAATNTNKYHLSEQCEVLKFLISSGADVHAKNQQGDTPLDVAQMDEIKHILREAMALVTVPLLPIIGIMEIRPSEGEPSQAIWESAITGHWDTVKEWIQRDPSLIDVTGAVMIRGYEHQEVSLCQLAAMSNVDVGILKFLVANGGDVLAKGQRMTPFHWAIQENANIEIVKFLMSQGADVNAKDWNDTPLSVVMRNNNFELLKCLISAGAHINEKGYCSERPLHVAARSYLVEIVKCLVSAGADKSAKDNKDWTPLHFAASGSSDVEVLKYLVSQGADVHAKARFGVTPLHHAAMFNPNIDVLRWLISSGADVNVQAAGNRTPLDVADTEEKMRILRAAGAKTGKSTKPQSLVYKLTPKNEKRVGWQFANYILFDSIIPEIKATDKEGVIREMVQSLVNVGGIKKENYAAIVKAFIKREELGSTGIGRGVAVPETKHPSVKRNVATIAVSAKGIDFDSLDDEKVQLFVMVISPPDRPGDHLRMLEHITRQLKDDTFCRFLQQSNTQEDIVALLEEDDSRS
jgi:ankyrin repeat protein/mannitol/fructose-specific phosphotransferase system IIA component (Ntr-type)